MAIQLNPNRINTGAGNQTTRRSSQGSGNQDKVIVPKRADVNYIPGPESLQTLINSGVESLRRGVAWDRGTILNLLA